MATPDVRLPLRGVYYDMRRIGFRWLLPLVFTTIHVVLVWLTLAHQPHRTMISSRDSEYRPISNQEGFGVPIDKLSAPPLKPVQKAALILDLPAMFLALMVAGILFPRDEMAWLYTSLVFVPPLWFAIGRWLDGLVGYLDRLLLPKIVRGLFAVAAYGLLCISIAGLTPLNRHRTPDSYWAFTGMALWSGLCVAIMLSSSRAND